MRFLSLSLSPISLPRFSLTLVSPRITGDDVAVPRSQGALTGRRGLAGTVLTYKLAGSLASKGASLDEVEHLARLVSENCGTMGMGLQHCHVPGTQEQNEEDYLKRDEAEIGMGIVSFTSQLIYYLRILAESKRSFHSIMNREFVKFHLFHQQRNS